MNIEIRRFKDDVEKFGFKKIYETNFEVNDDDHILKDSFYVYFIEKYGILLEFDTYNGKSINGGRFGYEWIPNDIKSGYLYTSTRGYETVEDMLIWAGETDCRNNMIGAIQALSEHGTFVTPWICKSHFGKPRFVHWGDHHTHYTELWGHGFEKYQNACVNEGRQRYDSFPESVKKKIGIAYQVWK